jgi:hypothetical protein
VKSFTQNDLHDLEKAKAELNTPRKTNMLHSIKKQFSPSSLSNRLSFATPISKGLGSS